MLSASECVIGMRNKSHSVRFKEVSFRANLKGIINYNKEQQKKLEHSFFAVKVHSSILINENFIRAHFCGKSYSSQFSRVLFITSFSI